MAIATLEIRTKVGLRFLKLKHANVTVMTDKKLKFHHHLFFPVNSYNGLNLQCNRQHHPSPKPLPSEKLKVPLSTDTKTLGRERFELL